MEGSAVMHSKSYWDLGCVFRPRAKEIIHIFLTLNSDPVRHAYIAKGESVHDALVQAYKIYKRVGGITTIDKKTGILMYWVNDNLAVHPPNDFPLYHNDTTVRLKLIIPQDSN